MHGSIIRVAIADDDAAVRAVLRRYLSQEHDLRVVAECSDGLQAMQVATAGGVDVLLLDMSMPRGGGLGTISALRALGATTKVVVFTGEDDEDLKIRALLSGASAYLLKSASPVEILRAIRSA